MEFHASLAITADSLLAIPDFAASRLALFDIGTGWFREFIPLPTRFWTMSASGDALVGGAVDVTSWTSATLISAHGGGVPRRSGPVRALFHRVPATSAICGQMDAIMLGDSLLTAFEVSDAIYVDRHRQRND